MGAGAAHYGASKHALCGLTKIMALEYAPNKIRINAIAPTVIETDMVRKYLSSAVDKEQAKAVVSDTNPMVGPGDPLPQIEDVTGVVGLFMWPRFKIHQWRNYTDRWRV